MEEIEASANFSKTWKNMKEEEKKRKEKERKKIE